MKLLRDRSSTMLKKIKQRVDHLNYQSFKTTKFKVS